MWHLFVLSGWLMLNNCFLSVGLWWAYLKELTCVLCALHCSQWQVPSVKAFCGLWDGRVSCGDAHVSISVSPLFFFFLFSFFFLRSRGWSGGRWLLWLWQLWLLLCSSGPEGNMLRHTHTNTHAHKSEYLYLSSDFSTLAPLSYLHY